MIEQKLSEAIEYAYQFDPSMHIPRNWARRVAILEAKLEECSKLAISGRMLGPTDLTMEEQE